MTFKPEVGLFQLLKLFAARILNISNFSRDHRQIRPKSDENIVKAERILYCNKTVNKPSQTMLSQT